MQGLGYSCWNSGSPVSGEVALYVRDWEAGGLNSKKVDIFLGTNLITSHQQTVIVARIPEMVYRSLFSIYSLWIIPLWLIAGSKYNS